MSSPADRSSSDSPRVVVIGTGFAGLGMGIRLKQAGIDSFTIFEKASSLGGTWRDNDYPGAACDVQSHLYSFSFEKNPRWSRMFARQGEIRSYLEHCAEKYGVKRHIRFDSEVVEARYDEASSTWTVVLATGERLIADVVVTATGGLSRPAYPNIPGIESFEGRMFHSARWDHSFDLTEKKVGVVGTGASAIQFVPQIAGAVEKLSLFQRTPAWILPKPDRALSGTEQWLYRVFPPLQWLYRSVVYLLLELRVLGFAVNPRLMQLPQQWALRHLAETVPDAALREKLTPKYTIGCKRILISNDFYPAVSRANVSIVDTGIREITRDGVITTDGVHHPLDAIILGTGFQASESVAPFMIQGRRGQTLADVWKDGAEAYLGTTVAGFPNLFMIVGPNTGLGHSSMVFMIESQVEHVMRALAAMKTAKARSIEVRSEVQRLFNDALQKNLEKSVWASGCMSWYRTSTGKNTTLWHGFTFTFRRRTRDFREAEFFLEGPSTATETAANRAAVVGEPAQA